MSDSTYVQTVQKAYADRIEKAWWKAVTQEPGNVGLGYAFDEVALILSEHLKRIEDLENT